MDSYYFKLSVNSCKIIAEIYLSDNQMSFFSLRTLSRAASPCPVERTNPEIAIRLDLPKLIVPSSFT